MTPVTIDISTESGDREFEFRWRRDEGVGLLTTKGDVSYLVLDSVDYWFEVIHYSYPKKQACRCKSTWFSFQFDFVPRSGTEDFRSVSIRGSCSSCGQEKKFGSIDLDYSPTQHLLDSPITFCKNPKLKCAISRLNGYWTKDDRVRFISFLADDLKLHVSCWYWNKATKKRQFEKLSGSNRPRLLSSELNYLTYYFSVGPQQLETSMVDGGIYVEDNPWQKYELIQLNAPMKMALKNGLGDLYYVYFSTQYIDAGVVRDKSESFIELSGKITEWMKSCFVEKRGRDCFDSALEYDRLVGNN